MFNKIYDDLLLMILFNLTNINDIINLSEINTVIYKSINNDIYIEWGRNLYSKNFWDRATKRRPIHSKPLPNMKMELLRIQRFNDVQIKHGHQLWSKEDYYKYWDSMEEGDTVASLTPSTPELRYQDLRDGNQLNIDWQNYWRVSDYINSLLF